jgi:hypothetical protein
MVANEIGVGGECRPVNNRKFEVDKKRPSVPSLQTIKRTFEHAGVEFPEGEPPRLKAGGDQ